jgi:multiple sugar transport system permease protein
MAAVTAPTPELSRDRDRRELTKRTKRLIFYAILLFFAFLYLMPFILAVSASFKTRAEVAANPLGVIPDEPTLAAWQVVANSAFPRWLTNSVITSVSITLGRLFLDSLAGYALARLNFPGRKLIFAGVVATLAVPGIVLAVPRFLVLRELGLLNSYAGIILPLAVDAFGIFLMKQFFESIPTEIEEAAKVDGASVYTTWWRIVMPMAAPGLIALTILSFQGSWNEFLHPLIAAPTNSSVWTLPLGLAQIAQAGGESINQPVAMAGSMLTTLPVLIVFLIFQRFFIQGVAATGVKG